jgi:hypothetical protein
LACPSSLAWHHRPLPVACKLALHASSFNTCRGCCGCFNTVICA